ncbi:epoxide hydrolase family protein [Micromonospora coxensis]|uniref:Pimeloyl-ACP methyl ester carboxylesterase n=1 Tax=Micromonospora coxensis TaxID=356852 RepID=A0A1C5K062_9ACTN|nr:epoxide hydrolase family protein [Micromonospora coxensis]SCG76157.1 Pimeloyl-ACP methyl ester carboxylesterase [Micromonospora coxensis]
MTATAFRISVPDDVLDDLRSRLVRTRFTTASDTTAWAAGVDPGQLRDLVDHWAHGFDWRAAEAALNTFPHYLAEIAGARVHFVHLRAERPAGTPAPLPLVLTHGWPSSFVEMLAVARRLADPVGHGADAADAFDVVVPSLPGFLYSEPVRGPFTRRRVAEVWHALMTGTLGYDRFGAFGGDIGGGVTQWLGALYPGEVTGIHITSAVVTTDFRDQPPTAEEQAYLDALAAYDATDGGYSEIMCTRPDTLAAALADSPAGLLAWIIDKYREWSDCGGDLESQWDRDTILTVATLYWVTGTIGSSFQQYYHYPLNRPVPAVTVPAAVTLSHEPAYAGLPRSLTERVLTDLRHWSTPGRGGHFMAHEEPEQVADELRTFFRPLRSDG